MKSTSPPQLPISSLNQNDALWALRCELREYLHALHMYAHLIPHSSNAEAAVQACDLVRIAEQAERATDVFLLALETERQQGTEGS
jgi:hypothetical protein